MTDLILPPIPQNLDPMMRDAFADWLAWVEATLAANTVGD